MHLEEFGKSWPMHPFSQYHAKVLTQTLESILTCQIQLEYRPIRMVKRTLDVDLLQNVWRTGYPIDASSFLLCIHPRIAEKRRISIAIRIKSENLPLPSTSFLDHLAKNIQERLELSIQQRFQVPMDYFGNSLVEDTITDYLSIGGYNPERIRLLLSEFDKLRTQTFENRNFTTGIIITRSFYSYIASDRAGIIQRMKNPYYINPGSARDRRFWYLVDGKTSFFMANQKLFCDCIFLLSPDMVGSSPISSYLLKETLMGRDLAFRTVESGDLVVVTEGGEEFSTNGVEWRFRDFSRIFSCLRALLPKSRDESVSTLLDIIFQLIYSRMSSLIWLPRDLKIIREKTVAQHHFVKGGFPINSKSHEGLIRRILSSDGALVLDENMNVAAYGIIVDLSKFQISDDKETFGSGHLAARQMSESGVAIKVSQDGTASIYSDGDEVFIL